MTAPTPDEDQHEDRALDNAYARLEDASRALAAVTAERDQAVRELAEQKRINTSNLQTMTKQLDQARQMVADAPHADDCTYLEEDVVEPYGTRISPNAHCNCWKAGL